MSGSAGSQRMASVQRRFEAFCSDVGLNGPSKLDPDLIEAFVVNGLPLRRSSTKGTYRSLLAKTAPGWTPCVRGTPFSGSAASPPYGDDERAGLLAMACAQKKLSTRRSALCVLAGGIGAGLVGRELTALRGSHVQSIDGGVAVAVGGSRSRSVPVIACWGSILLGLSDAAGKEYLFYPGHGDRTYKNFVNNFCYHLVRDPALPSLCASRSRSSFICDHLGAGTPLSKICAITGIKEVESLARYARYVDGVTSSKAALRRRQSDEWHR